jgi:hypothetical protein
MGETALGAQCRCLRKIVISCPTVADIPLAQAKMSELGWGYNERGGIMCPECLASSPAEPSPPPRKSMDARQVELF